MTLLLLNFHLLSQARRVPQLMVIPNYFGKNFHNFTKFSLPGKKPAEESSDESTDESEDKTPKAPLPAKGMKRKFEDDSEEVPKVCSCILKCEPI